MELEGLATKFSLYKELSKIELQLSKDPVSNNSSNDKAPKNQEDAVVSNVNQVQFNQKLYKHISDYYSGKGNLSSGTNRELVKKDQKVSSLLISEDPKSSKLYSGYRTAAFTYGTEARFVSNLESSLKSVSKLKKIYA